MTEIIEIADPQGVINSLQARIAQLERALEHERQRELAIGCEAIHGTLKSVRKHGVILLHLGLEDLNRVREHVVKYPFDRVTMEHAWPLASAPVPPDVKTALREAANYGMDRWN